MTTRLTVWLLLALACGACAPEPGPPAAENHDASTSAGNTMAAVETPSPLPAAVGSAAAGAGGGLAVPADEIHSLYEMKGISDVPSALADFLQRNAGLPGSVTPAPLSAAAARESLLRRIEQPDNRPFLDAIADTPDLASADGLTGAAMVAFAQGYGGEAFTLAVMAAEKARQDPAAQLNLAAAALAVGLANEALALLDELHKSGTPLQGPWGMAGSSLLDYLRGYAHMLRGEFTEARALLSRVVQAEPNLREAAQALALVEARLGGDPRRSFLLGVWRQRGRLMVRDSREPPGSAEEARYVPDPFAEGNDVGMSLTTIFDTTAGKPGALQEIEIPATPPELLGTREQHNALRRQYEAKAGELSGLTRITTVFPPMQPLSFYETRMLDLYVAATSRYFWVIEIEQAARETDYYYAELDRLAPGVMAGTQSGQAEITRRHIENLTRLKASRLVPPEEEEALDRRVNEQLDAVTQKGMDELRGPLRAYFRALDQEYGLRSAYMHGMLAYIGHPGVRDALLSEAESMRYAMQVRQLDAIALMRQTMDMRHGDYFGTGRRVGDGAAGSGPPCSAADQDWSMTADFIVVGVEISCNSVSVEAEASLAKLVGVSAEVGVDLQGNVTIFAGPKGDAYVAAVKSGVYITANREGIRDAGIKSEMKVSSGAGPFKVSNKVGEATVSFLPAPDMGPPPGPLPEFRSRT